TILFSFLSNNQAIIAQEAISPPILKKVLGGGFIELAEGDHDVFNIAIFYTKEGFIKGHFDYKMIRKNLHIMFTSENITYLEIKGDTAIIQGLTIREDVGKNQKAEYSFQVIAKDCGEKLGSDNISVRINGPNGFIHEVSEATIKGQIIIMNEIELPSYNIRGGKVFIKSNSKIERLLFYPDHGILNLTISGAHGTRGYMNITLKKETIDGQPIVSIDNKPVSILVKSNETHHEVYFEYTHSVHEIAIYGTATTPIPEFKIGSILVLSIFIVYIVLSLKKQKIILS
ncbi:MAG: hypothetical protein QW723_05905, partial [Candidatus Bathyarchaeia archaeon]